MGLERACDVTGTAANTLTNQQTNNPRTPTDTENIAHNCSTKSMDSSCQTRRFDHDITDESRTH